jgi:hypothetical protein
VTLPQRGIRCPLFDLDDFQQMMQTGDTRQRGVNSDGVKPGDVEQVTAAVRQRGLDRVLLNAPPWLQ